MPLTPDQVAKNLQENPDIISGQRKIQHLSQIVYNNPNILQEKVAEILKNPLKGNKVLAALVKNPESFGPFSGFKLFGVRSSTRKCAEENFWTLYDAVEAFIRIAQKAREEITRDHTKQENPDKQKSPKAMDIEKHQHVRNKQKLVCSYHI